MKTGIAGGIGAGKSFVCDLLRRRGINVYDCDAAAKRLMATSPAIRQALQQLIGPKAYDSEGRLARAVVSKFLLKSDANAAAINKIVHPAVFRDFIESGASWMESAIMYESGIYRLVDRVVAVVAPEEVRTERIMQRDHLSREKAIEWIRKQMPQEEVARRADFVIVNDGTAPLEEQIEQILNKISTL